MVYSAVKHGYLNEGLITAISIGGFFIILGAVFAFTPGIAEKTSAFFSDLTTVSFPFGSPGSTVSLLAPAHPAEHQDFYAAVMTFLIGVGVLQVVVLALRLAMHSRIRRVAQSVGDLIFWLGAAIVANVFLLTGTHNGWFQFWASLIVIIGLSLIARFFVYFISRSRRKDE